VVEDDETKSDAIEKKEEGSATNENDALGTEEGLTHEVGAKDATDEAGEGEGEGTKEGGGPVGA
jgi:hypothetical protein